MGFINGFATVMISLGVFLFGFGAAGFALAMLLFTMAGTMDEEVWHTPRIVVTLRQKVSWPFGEEIEADEVKTE